MEPEITAKSTKNEILAAYQAALKQLAEAKRENRQEEKTRREQKAVVETATATTVEGIVKGLAELKLGIGRALDDLETQLTTEARRLAELRQAIEVETAHLSEIHDIQAEAGSLAALLAAQEEKRGTFARAMEEKAAAFDGEQQERRAQWKREQEEYERGRKERDEQLRKQRAREEEEYAYTLQLARKKEEDDYTTRRAQQEQELEARRLTLEKSWAERESTLGARESELAELRARVQSLPQDMEQAIGEAEVRLSERLSAQHGFEKEMLTRDAEAERKLKDQLIDTLTAKIRDQEERIRELSRKADEAAASVQGIALKALETGAARRSPDLRQEEGVK